MAAQDDPYRAPGEGVEHRPHREHASDEAPLPPASDRASQVALAVMIFLAMVAHFLDIRHRIPVFYATAAVGVLALSVVFVVRIFQRRQAGGP